ncbi:Inactive phospholipase C-like protein 2 [Chamberlinius hualienensis]
MAENVLSRKTSDSKLQPNDIEINKGDKNDHSFKHEKTPKVQIKIDDLNRIWEDNGREMRPVDADGSERDSKYCPGDGEGSFKRCSLAVSKENSDNGSGSTLKARNNDAILLLPPSPPPPPPPSPSPQMPSGVDDVSTANTPPKQHKKAAKSVSFHSATSLPTERKISNATDCLQYMIAGSNLLKIRSSSRQYHRFFTLNEDLTAVRWTPTNKKSAKAMLPIDSIREIRSGKNTDVFKNKDLAGSHSTDCSFSIIYGETFEVLDLVASTPEEANIWATGLNALIGTSKSPECHFEERQHLREKYPLI